jgi:ribosomal protein S18 acetylase RimI-like enzyme
MTIRKAKKQDNTKAAVLIYDAIHDIAHALTGEKEKQKVLEQLERYFCQEVNRLSYHNCLVKTIDEEPVGIVIAYHGKDARQLDEPICAHLKNKTSKEHTLDQEVDDSDYYLDTVSVNPNFAGQGIGTELLQAVFDNAQEQGFNTVSLNVEENNAKARRLYERLGFTFKKQRTINNHLYDYLVKQL